MKRTSVAELKAHLSEHLRAAEAGETIEIVAHNRPIARLIPLEREEETLEVIAAERPFAEVAKLRFEPLDVPMSALEALRLERGDR